MTIDVSHLYHAQTGSTFGLDTGFGGDVIALSSGRVDPARLEIHEAVEAESARTGLDYADALDAVLAKAAHGVVTLSQAALESAGVTPPASRPGRAGRRHHPVTGEVVKTLAGGPTSEQLGGPAGMTDADRARWADTLASCEARKPDATVAAVTASSKAATLRAGFRWVGD